MAWIETESLSFAARHEAQDSDSASARWTRSRSCGYASRSASTRCRAGHWSCITTPGLAGAGPSVPARRALVGGAGRAALPGRLGDGERAARPQRRPPDRRAAGEDSLRGAARHRRAPLRPARGRREQHRLPPSWAPRRFARYLRWTWLVEGARPVLRPPGRLSTAPPSSAASRGAEPAFPPSRRDAVILGGTIFDLLERERGPDACDVLASRLRREAHAAAWSWPSTRAFAISSGLGATTCAT